MWGTAGAQAEYRSSAPRPGTYGRSPAVHERKNAVSLLIFIFTGCRRGCWFCGVTGARWRQRFREINHRDVSGSTSERRTGHKQPSKSSGVQFRRLDWCNNVCWCSTAGLCSINNGWWEELLLHVVEILLAPQETKSRTLNFSRAQFHERLQITPQQRRWIEST